MANRVRVQMQAAELAAKVAAISEKAEEILPAAQTDIRMVTPATKLKFKIGPKDDDTAKDDSSAPPQSAPPSANAPMSTIILEEDEDDDELLNLDNINSKAAKTANDDHDAMDIDEPSLPKAKKEDAGKKAKKDKVTPPAKASPTRRKLEFIDAEAEDDDDNKEDKYEESNSEDRDFIAANDEIEYEDEEAEREDQNRKKKGRGVHGDPFRAKEIEAETRKMRKLAALYEKDSSDTKSRTSLLKSVSGIKGVGVDKTYKNDDSDELDADAEQALVEAEKKKILGDDEEEDLSENERVRREEADDAASTKNKTSKKDTSLNLDLSDDDEEEEEDDAMAADDDQSDNAASDNEDEEPAKSTPQVAKGKIETITFSDDEDEPKTKNKDKAKTTPNKNGSAASATTTTTDNKPPVGVIDRRKVSMNQVPKIKSILIEKQIRERDAPSSLIETFTAATYLAAASGMIGSTTKSKPNQDTLLKINSIMTPFLAPIETLAEAVVNEVELSPKMDHEKLLPFFLTMAPSFTYMKLIQGVRTHRPQVCALTGQLIQPDSLMNLLMVDYSGLTTTSGKTEDRVLYVPVALNFPVTKKAATAASKNTQRPPSVPDAPIVKSNKGNEDKMDIEDSTPTNAKEEAEEEEEHEEDDEEHEEDEEPDSMISEPTDPKERLEQGFDGFVIKKPESFIMFNTMVRKLASDDKVKVVVAWKPTEGSGDAVQLFDPATSFPKVEHPWTGLTTLGFFTNLFEFKSNIKQASNTYQRVGGDKSWLHVKTSELSQPTEKSLQTIHNFAVEFNKSLFEKLWNFVSEKKDSFPAEKIQNTAGAVMVKNARAYDDESVKPFYEKPEKGQYFLERIRFLPRLLAQLLIKEPIYIAKKK